MIGVDIIKQSLENNSRGISTDLVKRIAILKIEERFQNSFPSYTLSNIVERIAESRLDDNDKQNLFKFLKEESNKTYEDMKTSLKDLFGSTSSSKDNESKNNEEEKDNENDEEEKDNENNNDDEEENGLKGPRETPAENVINNNDENDNRVVFNY